MARETKFDRMLNAGKGRLTLKQLEELVRNCKERKVKHVLVEVLQKTGKGDGTERSPHVMKTMGVESVDFFSQIGAKDAPEVLELTISLLPEKKTK